MCGRYTLFNDYNQLIDEFDLDELSQLTEFDPRYNIAPTQSVPVVRIKGGRGLRQLEAMRWGLIPHWAKDMSIGSRMINARSESVSSKPSFRAPLKRQRCLVPSHGFFEWKKIAGGTSRRPNKQPYYIRRRDERVMAFAGLWGQWQHSKGGIVESFTILTTQPNELMSEIHDRMPVIVDSIDYALWLDPGVQELALLEHMFIPFSGDRLVSYPVSKQVNSPANDIPSCIQEAHNM